MLLPIALGVVLVMAATYALIAYRQRNVRKVFYCPSCGQRIRFRLGQVGSLGRCPRCLTPISPPRHVDAGSKPKRRTRVQLGWGRRAGATAESNLRTPNR